MKIDKRGCITILDRFVREKGYRPATALFGTFVKNINALSIDGGEDPLDTYYRSLSGFVAALSPMARYQTPSVVQSLTFPLLSIMTIDAMLSLIDPFLGSFIREHNLDKRAWEIYTTLIEKGVMVSPKLEEALQLHETSYEDRQAIEKLLAAGLAQEGSHWAQLVPALPLNPKLLRFIVNQVRTSEAMKKKEIERGSPEYFRAQFEGTLFEPLLDVQLPFVIPQETRSEHGWILAPQGTGKTQLIQLLVSHDFPAVAANRRTVVVMDSSGDLISQIRRLALFAPGGALHGKLIVIEPDVEYPLALNPFDMGRSRLASYSPRERERLHNSTLDLLEYVFNSLMGAGATLTDKQSTLFVKAGSTAYRRGGAKPYQSAEA